MSFPSDIKVIDFLRIYSVKTDASAKFGAEVLLHGYLCDVKVTVQNKLGEQAHGWGETPLSVQWVWPSHTEYSIRYDACWVCKFIKIRWESLDSFGHCIEMGRRIDHARPARGLKAVQSWQKSR